MVKNSYQYPFSYDGCIFWPILFLILFLPIGIALLILNGHIHKQDVCYSLSYKGSRFWLLFWTLVFFPIAIILGILNGFDVEERWIDNCPIKKH